MSGVATAIAGGAILGAVVQSDSSRKASHAQGDAAQTGMSVQQQQFDAVRKLLDPYVKAGNSSLMGQQDLLGLNGTDAQSGAINTIQNSPMFTGLVQQGENSILQNASATGGLRGGNVQGALANFRPSMLSALIDQQYGRLGGITSLGQNAAAGVGNAGMQTGNAVTQLLQQQGAASAGGILANGRAIGGAVGNLGGLGAYYYGLNGQPSYNPNTGGGGSAPAVYGAGSGGLYETGGGLSGQF